MSLGRFTLGERIRAVFRRLAAEIALLFKSKGTAAKDEADFQRALPPLDAERRAWLRDALSLTLPDHHWISELAES